ncbi:hypothetical protein HY641_04400 [Candidatus Woesearchaeota archaeon]|nr:hypothetical protein [Candidatus Woesearchaeota archaeon]
MRPDIIKETAISISEAKTLLDHVKERDGELNYRAAKTAEYLDQFASLSEKKSKDVTKKILALDIPRMRENHIAKILDCHVKTVEDIKVVLQPYSLTLKEEHLKNILEIIETVGPKLKTEETPAAE